MSFKDSKQAEKKNTLLIIALILAIVIFIGTAAMLIIKIVPPKNEYADYVKNTPQIEEELPENPIDFASLKAQNPDVCAFITVEGTDISYPVLRSGEDKQEDYYLKRNIENKYSSAGSIYMQRYNSASFSDSNTVLYGHNMKNGSMFGQLKRFRNREFFDANKTIYVYTEKSILKYNIASAFVYDDRHILSSFDFTTEEGFNEYADVILNPATTAKNVTEKVKINPENRFLTLSTCTGRDTERFLVVGYLVEETKTK